MYILYYNIATGLTDELLSLYKIETLEGREHVMNVFAKGLLQQWLGDVGGHQFCSGHYYILLLYNTNFCSIESQVSHFKHANLP